MVGSGCRWWLCLADVTFGSVLCALPFKPMSALQKLKRDSTDSPGGFASNGVGEAVAEFAEEPAAEGEGEGSG